MPVGGGGLSRDQLLGWLVERVEEREWGNINVPASDVKLRNCLKAMMHMMEAGIIKVFAHLARDLG